jgi:hypothetical protein
VSGQNLERVDLFCNNDEKTKEPRGGGRVSYSPAVKGRVTEKLKRSRLACKARKNSANTHFEVHVTTTAKDVLYFA